jgi:hypothetical protein
MKKILPNLTLKMFALVFGIFLAVSAFAQTVNLTGTLQDGNSIAINGVQVSLKNHSNINTTTNATGSFVLNATISGVAVLAENETISFGPNGIVYLSACNEPVRVDIFNISGQLLNSIVSDTRLNGTFQVFTSAYLPQDNSIYIVRVMVGNEVKSTKFISSYSNASKGIIEISNVHINSFKSAAISVDSIVLTQIGYKTLKVGLTSYTGNLGIITMEALPVLPVAPGSLTTIVASSTQINLSWTDNSNNETTFNIERAPGGTTNFTEIATVSAGITTYQNTCLTAGASCVYRVRAHNSAGYSGYTNTSTATTQNVATLRIQNSTKYALISIKLNGTERLQFKNYVPVGNYIDYTFTSSGSVTYSILVGLMDSNGNTTDFFTFNGTVQVTVGQVYTLTCTNPTLAQVLSGFSASKQWDGYYYDANNNYKTCAYIFYSDGSFRLYDGAAIIGTGNTTLVTWDDYATIISFKLGTTETIQMMYPFSSFIQGNGPASWKNITYTKKL